MSVEFTCGDPAALAGFLYNECDAAERNAIEAHLAGCPSCVEELRGLGAARSALAATTLRDMGIGNVVNMLGGFAAWQQKGGAIER